MKPTYTVLYQTDGSYRLNNRFVSVAKTFIQTGRHTYALLKNGGTYAVLIQPYKKGILNRIFHNREQFFIDTLSHAYYAPIINDSGEVEGFYKI